jgi:hypothetical protein
MARVLHLLKGEDPSLALTVITQQVAAGDDVAVALLPGASPAQALPTGVELQRVPDQLGWDALLERIFEADQVISW